MSSGQSPMRNCSARTALKRCNNRSHKNTIIIDIDVDIGVIIVDSPESSSHKSICSKGTKRKHPPTVIYIKEDVDTLSKSFHSFSSNSYGYEEFERDDCEIINMKSNNSDGRPRWMFGSTSKADTAKRDILDTEDFEGDCSDCEIIDDSSVDIREQWEKAALKKKAGKRGSDSKEGTCTFCPHMSGVSPCKTSGTTDFNRTNCDTRTFQDKGGTFADANTSVDRTDHLLSAKLKRKGILKALDRVLDDSCNLCDFEIKDEMHPGKSSPQRCHSSAGVTSDHATTSNQDEWHQSPLSHDPLMQNGPVDNKDNQSAFIFATELSRDSQFEEMQSYERLSPCNVPCSPQNIPGPEKGNVTEIAKDSSCSQPQDECAPSKQTNFLHEQQINPLHTHPQGQEANSHGSTGNIEWDINPVSVLQSNDKNVDIVSESKGDIIGQRERLKESDEYKRAEEEEWASRQRELLIQSEEAQRLRKRKKAENLRLLDMERRQKQRLKEIHEAQKQDEETVNLKDQIRVEVQKELEKLEMNYKDMVSLLRALGISVSGGSHPLPHEVNAAYKQALLRFHPDRALRTDIRQQVEAEEKFKLISRFKEKLLPVTS